MPSAIHFSDDISTIDVTCSDIDKHIPNLVNTSGVIAGGFKLIRNKEIFSMNNENNKYRECCR